MAGHQKPVFLDALFLSVIYSIFKIWKLKTIKKKYILSIILLFGNSHC